MVPFIMAILTRKQAKKLDPLKIKIINALWSAENTALDETSWARLRQDLKCIHKNLQEALDVLGLLPVNSDDQVVPFPFSENGDADK